MQAPFLSITRLVLVVALSGAVLSSIGCRSTRSSLAGLPGMAWVGPRDEDATFGSWADSDRPSLPTPSQQATPQLATDSGTASKREVPSSQRSPQRGLSDSLASGTKGSTPETEYPDTGYPSTYAENKSSGRSGYETRAHTTLPTGRVDPLKSRLLEVFMATITPPNRLA